MGTKKLAALIVPAVLLTSGCSIRHTRVINVPGPTETTTVTAPAPTKQALDWTVVTSNWTGTTFVVLSFGLCPDQTLLGPPVVQASAQTIAITLWATPATCVRGTLSNITVQLPSVLGLRSLTNPNLR